jgi:hypothetical protein
MKNLNLQAAFDLELDLAEIELDLDDAVEM